MKIKCVVPISGGKDSQACLKLALELFAPHEIRGLFCDTQFEHPKTYEHLDTIYKLYGVEIDRVCDGRDVPTLVKHFKRFPSFRSRFCTDRLKIRQAKLYYKALAEKQGGFEVWYGMRSGESTSRAKRYAHVISDELYPPHEIMKSWPKYLHKKGVVFRLSILDWDEREVYEYLGGEENPLYKEGFGRVGCFPCLASARPHQEKAYQHDETGRKHFEIVNALSLEINKSPYTSNGVGCMICTI